MNISFVINSLLLGVGLAMDAFSVSCTNGLNEPRMKAGRMSVIAGMYAWFQFMLPMIGWLCVHTIAEYFESFRKFIPKDSKYSESFRKFIPWIALLLLLYIGGKMLLEGIRGTETEGGTVLSPGTLILQAVATSIDALSVGFTIAEYDVIMALTACILIAAVTYVICMGGLTIGKKVGTRLTGKASILGGLILIGIGVEIFVTGIR